MDYTRYSGHTPGPWQFEKPNQTCTDETVFRKMPIHDNPDYICRVYGEGVTTSVGVPERNANLALIADAPLLLARCKRLETALEELVAEFDEADKEAQMEPGCGGLRETGGMVLARAALADEPEVEE